MAHFEVGRKVICIKTHPDGVVKKGDVRELLGIKKGCSHYPLLLDVGATSPATRCPHCFTTLSSDNTWWLDASRFAPYDDSLSETTAEELIEQLETELQNA